MQQERGLSSSPCLHDLHDCSTQYKDGAPYKGKRVLVVGEGLELAYPGCLVSRLQPCGLMVAHMHRAFVCTGGLWQQRRRDRTVLERARGTAHTARAQAQGGGDPQVRVGGAGLVLRPSSPVPTCPKATSPAIGTYSQISPMHLPHTCVLHMSLMYTPSPHTCHSC